MKKLKNVILKTQNISYEAGVLFLLVAANPLSAFAQSDIRSGVDSADTGGFADSLFGTDDTDGVFQNIVNALLFLIGAIAVVMLIIGGFRYVVSAGDSNAIESAKKTIMYAIVGIVVAFLAFAAVEFVLSSLGA